MSGPFPGMDPFLEYSWGDVHTGLMVYTANALHSQLPRRFRSWVEERISKFDEDGSLCDENSEPLTERTVYVSDGWQGPVITAIEFLGPHNKLSDEARQQFRRKQELLLAGGVNLVEIDLVRQGGWAISVREPARPQSWSYPYRACVVRAIRPSFAECYTMPLRERLPAIRIPLRPDDADLRLDLQQLIDAAWRDGRYDAADYARQPVPPFEPSDVEWINGRLAALSKERSHGS